MKKFQIVKIVLELFVFLSIVSCIIVNFAIKGIFGEGGLTQFRYFTVLSNLYLGIICLISAINTKKGNNKIITILYLGAILATTVTFLVTGLFLSRVYGFKMLYNKTNFFMHLVNPLVGLFLLGFIRFDLDYKSSLFALIPFLLYAIIYLVLVVGTKTWPDFYGFNQGGKWYITAIVMPVLVFILNIPLYFLGKVGFKNE